MEKSWVESRGIYTQHGYNSSSNSNNSSISSISSSSSDSVTTGARDLEADADSSCRQSGLSSNDQMETDCLKLVHFYLLFVATFVLIFMCCVVLCFFFFLSSYVLLNANTYVNFG